MKALLAYLQTLYNNVTFEWINSTHCKVTVENIKDGTVGSFIAIVDGNKNIIDSTDDTGMSSPNIKTPTPIPELPAEMQLKKKAGNK